MILFLVGLQGTWLDVAGDVAGHGFCCLVALCSLFALSTVLSVFISASRFGAYC